MGPLAIDMYLPALPGHRARARHGRRAVQVSLAVYFIGIAFGQAFYGPLSDRFGRKPALYFGPGALRRVVGRLRARRPASRC